MVKNLKLNSSFLLVLICLCSIIKAQTDTIYTTTNKKISCIVTEINDESISYLVNKSINQISILELTKITYKNGASEIFVKKSKNNPSKHIIGFDIYDEKTRNLIQKNASKWGAQYLNCSLNNLSLNSTYVDWDLTYLLPGNDSILNIGLKSMYSITYVEDREELFWSIKTNTKLDNPKFNYNRSSNHKQFFLNCISRLNSVSKP